MNVGTKELKNRLSFYLRRVRGGERVRVTDRGTPVAELLPIAHAAQGDGACLSALEDLGLVSRGSARCVDWLPVRVRARRRASAIVIEQRR
jgi:prevent-host-death family protein